MSRRLPEKAILDAKEDNVVTILQACHKNFFDVVIVRKNDKERRLRVHRSRLAFIPDRRSKQPDSPAGESSCLQGELPLG
jgi:molybdopterin-guanine dinucleotide biosynthesis protein A